MSQLRRSWTLGLAGILGLSFLILVVGALNSAAGPAASTTSWTPIFSDPFTTTLPAWTISDTVDGAFQWGVASHSVVSGSTVITDSGFWAAGGGSLGGAQAWPTGTYTNGMTTWAVAGPFTPTSKVWGVRLRFQVQNRVGANDALFVGLSYDNLHFMGMTLTQVLTDWQEMVWSAPVYSEGMPIWVMLRFNSDEGQVDTGPMVDDLRLEVNYGYNMHLPLVRRDPTPTPTATPLPTFYLDHFDDPTSGWFSGTALRYNHRLNPERWVWEEVAYMSYQSGHYSTYIPLTAHGGGEVDTWFVWPAHAAPLPSYLQPVADRYCIEARGAFVNSRGDYDPWWAHWGIVFGANASFSDTYTFQINANKRWAVIRYPTYLYPGGRDTDNETKIVDWGHQDYPQILGGSQFNTLKIVVRDAVAVFYVNGFRLGDKYIGSFPRAKVGLIGGDWEVTPVRVWIDYFRYDPNCPEAH
jgi:hypothetical protein